MAEAMNKKKIFGLLAQFNDPHAILKAVEKLTAEGVKNIDTHTPFPIHGMDKAMGLKDSSLGWVVALSALLGFSLGLGLQSWASMVAYPMIISGKPSFPWQAFVPITFELTILFSAFGTVFGMFAFNKLPRLHHPLFSVDRFKSFSTDGFFLSVEVGLENFDEEKIKLLLQDVGGQNIEEVIEE
ncbi:MAG: DUF3341 domain-containing protein [Gammaproteobacteria bacterium]|nr:DUF3341 domain-containing protein [Gammaproteobacteria bacterium]